jgi:hypothetical protein
VLPAERRYRAMTVIDITKDLMVNEVASNVKCVRCGQYGDHAKGVALKGEMFFTEYDLKNPNKVYVCDLCETES